MKDLSEAELLALDMWKQREMRFPERLRRMAPDKWDIWFGAWADMVKEAKAILAARKVTSR